MSFLEDLVALSRLTARLAGRVLPVASRLRELRSEQGDASLRDLQLSARVAVMDLDQFLRLRATPTSRNDTDAGVGKDTVIDVTDPARQAPGEPGEHGDG